MKIEKFTKISGRVMIDLIIFAIGTLIGPIIEYLISGLEPMIAVNLSIVCAIAAIISSLVHFIAIAIQNVRPEQAEIYEE